MFANWRSRAPALSRYAPYAGLFSVIGTFILISLTQNCVDSVFKSYQVWRPLTAPFVDNQFFSCIFGAVFLYICGNRIERVKGSVFLLHMLAVSLVLTGVLFTFVAGFLAYAPFLSFSTTVENRLTGEQVPNPSFCSSGFYPLVFALFVMETSLSNEEQRRFLCFPWMVATKSLPLVFLALFELMGLLSGFVRIDAACGLLVGYLYTYFITDLQISPSRARQWEQKTWLKWLTTQDTFVGVDANGTALPGVWSSPPQEQGGGGGGFAMPWGGQQMQGGVSGGASSAFSSGAPASAPARTDHSKQSRPASHVPFSGQGHSLGDGGSGSGGGSGTASGSVSAPQPSGGRSGGTHPLALRYAQQQEEERRNTSSNATDTLIDIQEDDLIDVPSDDAQRGGSVRDRIPLFDVQLQRLTELGYTEEDAVPALEFSEGDVERAVKYLQGHGGDVSD